MTTILRQMDPDVVAQDMADDLGIVIPPLVRMDKQACLALANVALVANGKQPLGPFEVSDFAAAAAIMQERHDGEDDEDEFPNALNTGVPAGTILTPSGSVTVNTNGAIIENLDITGVIVVNANNVMIRNCRVDATGNVWGIDADSRNANVTDCEIFNANQGNAGIIGQGGTYLRCNIYGFENGVVAQSDNLVEDCYIHDLGGGEEAHVDGISIQSGSNTIVRHCHVEAYDTSCVFIKDDFGALSNHTIENCRLINKPGQFTAFTVYSDARGPGSGITGVSFLNNIMEAGVGGYASIDENTVTWTNNRDYHTNALIPGP